MELGREDSEHKNASSSQPPPSPPASAVLDVRKGSDSVVVEEAGQRIMDHDSMVTVRLSEPPTLTVNTNVRPNLLPSRKSLYGNEYTPTDAMAETVQEEEEEEQDSNSTEPGDETPATETGGNLQDELQDAHERQRGENKQQESETRTSSDEEEVNWDELQKTEDQESKDQDSDKSTALLLARLEQENDKIATNPKSAKAQVVERPESLSRRPRPPSMAELRQMVNGPTPPALRYSMLPPPPMTDLEFYAALVKDYQQTAARLPTLLSNKVRKGIPPPLRGVVWQSMSGARDSALEGIFERLSGESSPYEGIIGKDLGRSFPGVDMFRDPDGDGQRMLGRVLKCFSLYDQKIGYCQGLAFLVGPLLMHMSDKQAFCVLVRLMECYDLRSCFLPDLAGLHVRIYQFGQLLRQNLPTLSAHLDDLQVDPAYVSQWFLSFFAVTAPLPMLFRIYDVIFAEGASETIMRAALALMRKNQGRILACTELEDVMQLLLSRGLWDCYHYNADEFVQDFVSLTAAVTKERLAALEQGYREARVANSTSSGSAKGGSSTNANAARASDVTTVATRFLGRLWASTSSTTITAPNTTTAAATNSSPKSSTGSGGTSSSLSPGLIAPSRPLSMLQRSASKQSLASTLNSMEASSSVSVLSSASTEATSISRDSSTADDSSTRESGPSFISSSAAKSTPAASSTNHNASDSRYLHSQIEDLLTALSELQRNHSLLADQLQREREEREEDKRAVRSLLTGLRKKASTDTVVTLRSSSSQETVKPPSESAYDKNRHNVKDDGSSERPSEKQLSDLLDVVEQRFGTDPGHKRRSSVPQTKAQLREELARAKELLANEVARTQDSGRRLADAEQEASTLRDQLRDSHAHARSLHQDKQRLEKQIHGMRVRASADSAPAGRDPDGGSDWFGRPAGAGAGGGLRELKLGRSKSTPSQTGGAAVFKKRTSTLVIKPGGSGSSGPAAGPLTAPPISEHEAILLELVQAKTAEAIARQEAEEVRQKLEGLRKAFGLAPGETPPTAVHSSVAAAHGGTVASAAASQASAAASAAMGMFGRLTASVAESTGSAARRDTTPAAPASAPATGTASGGFWGWRRA